MLDAVVPSVKVDDPAVTFPGALGRLATAGGGRTNRLEKTRVLVACDWEQAGHVSPDEFPPSFVDMAGPGADRSPLAASTNVVVTCRPAPDAGS